MDNTQVTPFTFEGDMKVRTVDIKGVPWFVAKDVCDILGLGNPTEALRNFPENERNTLSSAEGIHEGPGNPNVNIVNEPGLYRLIFQSRKPEAEAFKTWVFTEVLPAIRKKGHYRIMAQYEKEIALRSLPTLENPQSGEYRYKFFEFHQAPKILELLSKGVADGFIHRAELSAVLMSASRKEAWKKTSEHVIKTYIQENIVLTDSVKDFVVIDEAYSRFCKDFFEFASRQTFTRAIRKIFNYSILEWVKRINGKPTRVFVSCKLKEL